MAATTKARLDLLRRYREWREGQGVPLDAAEEREVHRLMKRANEELDAWRRGIERPTPPAFKGGLAK